MFSEGHNSVDNSDPRFSTIWRKVMKSQELIEIQAHARLL